MVVIFIKYLIVISFWGMTLSLSGCGLTQSISNGSAALIKSIIYKEIKTLHLDFLARPSLNNDELGQPHTVVIRIYQLRDRQIFDSTSYTSLFTRDTHVLKDDLVIQKDIRLRPDENMLLNIPLEPDARYIAIAGMFQSPNYSANTWRQVLKRDELDIAKARQIEVSNQQVILLPTKGT